MLTKNEEKEFGYRYKTFSKKNKDFIQSLSPLQGLFNGEWDWVNCDKEFFCENERYRKTAKKYKGKGFYEKDFIEIVSRIFCADIEIKEGNIEYIETRCDAIGDLAPLIGCINNARKVDLVHNLIVKSGLSDNTLFLIKMAAYGTLEKYDEEGTKLTRICIGNNDVNTIYSASAEEDVFFDSYNSSATGNNSTQIMQFELGIIKEKIARGETITLYRGFSINDDERVRQGYKRDGEEYFKQRAGTGISYSLNRNVAGYFAMRSIMMEDGNYISGGNFWSKTYQQQMVTLQFGNLISKEGFVSARAKDISDMREERKLKPIICEYVLKPDKLKGYLLSLGESEVMALPEDIKLKKYVIANSRDIAECQYEWINKGSSILSAISGGLIKDGIVCWVSGEKYGKLYATFAPANDIKDDAKKFVDAYFSGKSEREIAKAEYYFKIAMEKYAIKLPSEIEPTSPVLTNALYKYLRNPINVVREAGLRYRIGTKKKSK